jgi:Fic family protein
METGNLWKSAEDLSAKYKCLNVKDIIDYEKYRLYTLVTSSTALEGGTLTEGETQLLIEEGLTAKGKPLLHHLMVKDNYNAISYAFDLADRKTILTPELLRKFNSYNMESTDAAKIPSLVNVFCKNVNDKLQSAETFREKMQLSFIAHANLVLIHPWGDGNKRTSRLLMNYIQRYFDLPLTKIDKEDLAEYLSALKAAKTQDDFEPFENFMLREHIKTVAGEIENLEKEQKRGFNKLLFF